MSSLRTSPGPQGRAGLCGAHHESTVAGGYSLVCCTAPFMWAFHGHPQFRVPSISGTAWDRRNASAPGFPPRQKRKVLERILWIIFLALGATATDSHQLRRMMRPPSQHPKALKAAFFNIIFRAQLLRVMLTRGAPKSTHAPRLQKQQCMLGAHENLDIYIFVAQQKGENRPSAQP